MKVDNKGFITAVNDTFVKTGVHAREYIGEKTFKKLETAFKGNIDHIKIKYEINIDGIYYKRIGDVFRKGDGFVIHGRDNPENIVPYYTLNNMYHCHELDINGYIIWSNLKNSLHGGSLQGKFAKETLGSEQWDSLKSAMDLAITSKNNVWHEYGVMGHNFLSLVKWNHNEGTFLIHEAEKRLDTPEHIKILKKILLSMAGDFVSTLKNGTQ